VLLLRLRADAISKLSIKAAGRRSRGCARHSLAETAASYLAHWFRSPEVGSEFFSRARKRAGETRRVAAPSHPVPKNSGRRGGAFFDFPLRKGDYPAQFCFLLALAQASETEANSGRIRCRPEGILNGFIVSKSRRIHKAKTRGGIEFIAFLFSGLRGVCGRDGEPLAGGAKLGESKRLQHSFSPDFQAIPQAIPCALMHAGRSNAHGHYDVAVARGFIACRAELAGGLFVF